MTANASSRRLRLTLLLAFAPVIAIAAWLVFVRRDKQIAVGDELRIEEVGFTVEPPTYDRRNVPGHSAAQLIHLVVVQVRVTNHSLSVPYSLADHARVLVSGGGYRYAPSGTGVEGTKNPTQVELAPGESRVEKLYFEVADSARDFKLEIDSGSTGDALEHLLVGDEGLLVN